MRYSISLQKEDKREIARTKFLDSLDEEFPKHLYLHYSTQGHILLYLMRINPYCVNLIKLQNYKLEEEDRLFISFQNIELAITRSNENREIIPDFFCYFDYFLNLNCGFFGLKIDDFIIPKYYSGKNVNIISSFASALFYHVKLLNSTYISTILNQWVDIIFGKKQLPEKKEDYADSYNIYDENAYEQIIDLQTKIDGFYESYKKDKINKNEFLSEINQLDYIIKMRINFGVHPRQILNETIKYEGKNKTFEYMKKEKKIIDEKYIYFKKILDDNHLVIKENIKGNNEEITAVIYDNNLKEKKSNTTYECKSIFSLRNKNKKSFCLYELNYAFSYLLLKNKKLQIQIFVFLTCQYLDNYFRIQYNDRIITIFYEDFVTCIKGKNSNEGDDFFYTGLLNGKLTEWEILFDNNLYFKVKESKYVYAHKSSITAIEIYTKQNIIITSGEDKFIYIRKIFDFELLTVINLTYCFGNPIISETKNILPTLIKVSDLNLLYVLIYDKNKNNNFIRGYNLNGLFFAQTEPSNYLNFSFTKNSNLIVGFYDSNQFHVISASTLILLWKKEFDNNSKMIEYNLSECAFYRLYDNKIVAVTIKDPNELSKLDSL